MGAPPLAVGLCSCTAPIFLLDIAHFIDFTFNSIDMLGKAGWVCVGGAHQESMQEGVVMRIVIVVFLMVVLVLGCATPYKSSGFRGGYSETQLDENVFKVSFRGNGYTGRERASDFALLRCSELALQHGYKYFVVVDASTYSSNSTFTTPTTSRTTANAYVYGNQAHGNATTITTGGQTYTISKPSASNTIVCFVEKPDEGFSYNAEFIFRSISEKYGIKKTTK